MVLDFSNSNPGGYWGSSNLGQIQNWRQVCANSKKPKFPWRYSPPLLEAKGNTYMQLCSKGRLHPTSLTLFPVGASTDFAHFLGKIGKMGLPTPSHPMRPSRVATVPERATAFYWVPYVTLYPPEGRGGDIALAGHR